MEKPHVCLEGRNEEGDLIACNFYGRPWGADKGKNKSTLQKTHIFNKSRPNGKANVALYIQKKASTPQVADQAARLQRKKRGGGTLSKPTSPIGGWDQKRRRRRRREASHLGPRGRLGIRSPASPTTGLLRGHVRHCWDRRRSRSSDGGAMSLATEQLLLQNPRGMEAPSLSLSEGQG